MVCDHVNRIRFRGNWSCLVSIPSSSGMVCDLALRDRARNRNRLRQFQSLLRQGWSATRGGFFEMQERLRRFQSLLRQGWSATAFRPVGLDSPHDLVSIPSSSGMVCDWCDVAGACVTVVTNGFNPFFVRDGLRRDDQVRNPVRHPHPFQSLLRQGWSATIARNRNDPHQTSRHVSIPSSSGMVCDVLVAVPAETRTKNVVSIPSSSGMVCDPSFDFTRPVIGQVTQFQSLLRQGWSATRGNRAADRRWGQAVSIPSSSGMVCDKADLVSVYIEDPSSGFNPFFVRDGLRLGEFS